MNQTNIRTPGGELLGYLRNYPDKIEARTSGGQLLGWYDKAANRTYKPGGIVVSLGDTVSSLIRS